MPRPNGCPLALADDPIGWCSGHGCYVDHCPPLDELEDMRNIRRVREAVASLANGPRIVGENSGKATDAAECYECRLHAPKICIRCANKIVEDGDLPTTTNERRLEIAISLLTRWNRYGILDSDDAGTLHRETEDFLAP